MDLSKKININDDFQITYGRLLLTAFVTGFIFLGMWCSNNWILESSMFFLVSTTFLALEKKKEDKDEILERIGNIESRLVQIEESLIELKKPIIV